MRPRLLLADDHTLLLEGIRLMLEPEFDLVGSVEDGQALLAAAKKLKPDIILLDISMPLLNGIDAAHRLRKMVPSARLIFLTMHAGADYVAEAFRAGARGYLLKRSAASELLAAIRAVLKGDHYVSPLVTRNALELLISSAKPGSKFSDRMSPRQREVLQLVAEGRSRKEIASILNISVKTVEYHKSKLMRELNLQGAADFTRYAIEHGIIMPERSS
ncbi:MAG: response regulator transcription factor [Acidobacteria bacterium]|nr:response regulator transcription factor [Acidobacteriota bacterium]